MKDQIISILGKNHKNCIELISGTRKSNVPYGLYTYRGGVYVLMDGEDLDFDDLELSNQKWILDQIISGNYRVNKALQ